MRFCTPKQVCAINRWEPEWLRKILTWSPPASVPALSPNMWKRVDAVDTPLRVLADENRAEGSWRRFGLADCVRFALLKYLIDQDMGLTASVRPSVRIVNSLYEEINAITSAMDTKTETDTETKSTGPWLLISNLGPHGKCEILSLEKLNQMTANSHLDGVVKDLSAFISGVKTKMGNA